MHLSLKQVAFTISSFVWKNTGSPKSAKKERTFVSSVFLDRNCPRAGVSASAFVVASKLSSELEQFEPAVLQPLADDEVVDLLLELARRYPKIFKYNGLGPLN